MALQRTLLISAEDVQNFASLSQYIETKYTNATIYDVQFQYVRPVLCDALYSELITALQGTPPLSPELDLLLNGDGLIFEGIRAYLCWQVYVEWLVVGNSKSTQTGMQKLTSQFSEQLTENQLGSLIQHARSKAEFYKSELLRFLHENKADYPNACTDCEATQIGTGILNITSVKGSTGRFRLYR